jgi:hypothetical protein
VCIDYPTLVSTPQLLQDSIKKAFGSEPNCLGIIVVNNLPPEYPKYRERLLKLAEKFAAMPEDKREKYADSKSRYRCEIPSWFRRYSKHSDYGNCFVALDGAMGKKS